MRRLCLVAAGALAVIGAARTVGAAQSAPRGPDLELGRYLATECMTCHRRGAQATAASAGGAIPNIYGLAEATFVEVMKAYRAKQLPNAVMQTVTARLTDDDIEALAAFFARMKP